MRRTLLSMTITIASYVAVLFLVGGDNVLQRRITIVCELRVPSLRPEVLTILRSECMKWLQLRVQFTAQRYLYF